MGEPKMPVRMNTLQLEGDIQRCVSHVYNNFQYTKDPHRWFDFYRIMKLDNGKFRGDCEDFSLTVMWFFYGQSFWKFFLNYFILHRAFIWHVRTWEGNGHAVGYCDGVYFDNWSSGVHNTKASVKASLSHKFIVPIPSPLAALYFLAGWLFKR